MKNKKIGLLLLFLLLLMTIYVFFSYLTVRRYQAKIIQPKVLCNASIEDCSNTKVPVTPKGVCAPGGKCS